MNPCVIGAPAATPMVAAIASTAATAPSATLEILFADLLMAAQADAEPIAAKAAPASIVQPLLPDIQDAPLADESAEGSPIAEAEVADTNAAALMYALVEALPSTPLQARENANAIEPPVVEPIAGTPMVSVPVEDVSTESAPIITSTEDAVVEFPRAAHRHRQAAIREIGETTEIEAGPTPTSLLQPAAVPVDVPQQAALPQQNESAPPRMAPPASQGSASPIALTNAPSAQTVPAPVDSVRVGPAITAAPEASPQAPVAFEAHITQKDQTRQQKAITPDQPSSVPKDIRVDSEAAATPIKEIRHSEPAEHDAEPDTTPEAPKTIEPAAKPPATAFAVHEPAPLNDSKPQATEAPRRPSVILEPPDPSTAARTPLKQMDVRIPDANGDVMVRIQERAGGVQVSVRSNDSQMAGNLAQNLPDLTRTLDQQGFRAQTWTPRDVSASLSDNAAIAQPEASQHSQHQSQGQNEPEHQERQSNPDWQEEPRRRPKRQPEENFKEQL